MTHSLRPTTRQRPPAVQLQREVRALRRALGHRRRLRLMIRALWIALGIFAVGLAVRLFGFAAPWWIIGAPAVAAAVLLVIRSWFTDPTLPRLLADYDQHFQTQELLRTGLEVARQAERDNRSLGQIEQQLVDQCLRALHALRRRVQNTPIIPWREVEMFGGIALLVVGLLVVGRNDPHLAANALAIPSLPTAAPAEQPQTPTEQPVSATEPPADAPATPEDQAAADAIADALGANSATSGAGSALQQGQTGQAASELRDLADQSDQLSDAQRSDLAEDLRGAADQLAPSQPERAEQLRDQADQIERDAASAEQGLDDLADLVDQLGGDGDAAQGEEAPPSDAASAGGAEGESPDGQSGEGGGSGAGDGLGGESRGTQTDPVQAQGEITPLPPDPDANGPRTSATGPQGPNVELEAGGTRADDGAGQALGGGADAPLSGDADPLRIPPEYRDVVENYFSPSP